MKLLVACEESGTVRRAFRARGYEAYSCDLEPAEDGSEYHYQGDVLEIVEEGWDMLIAHPPCTYLANSGVHRKNADPVGRWHKMEEGAAFFKALLEASIDYIAIENPILHKYAIELIGRRQDQVIQPWMFGHPEQKATCLWLKNLPPLRETRNVKEQMENMSDAERQRILWLPPSKDRQKIRSRTFPGIAEAMAQQWGPIVENAL